MFLPSVNPAVDPAATANAVDLSRRQGLQGPELLARPHVVPHDPARLLGAGAVHGRRGRRCAEGPGRAVQGAAAEGERRRSAACMDSYPLPYGQPSTATCHLHSAPQTDLRAGSRSGAATGTPRLQAAPTLALAATFTRTSARTLARVRELVLSYSAHDV